MDNGFDVEQINLESQKDFESTETKQEVSFEDDILSVIAPTGRFQIRVMVWATLVDIPVVLCVLFFIFAAVNPGFTCVSETVNSTTLQEIDFNNVCEINGTSCSQVVFDNRTQWTIISEVRFLYFFPICRERVGSRYRILLCDIAIGLYK